MTAYSEKCDMWSLGICFYLMLCGELPFSGTSDTQVLRRVRTGKFKFEPEDVWSEIREEATQLIQGALVVEPDKRLSAQEALDHPCFQSPLGKTYTDNEKMESLSI